MTHAILGPVPRVHAARLELTADRAGRNFTVGILARQPDFDVIGLLRGEAHVASTQRYDAIVEVEFLEDLLGAGQHALVLFPGFFRRGDRDKLHLGELVLADHPPSIFSRRASLGPKTWRAGGEPHR